MCRHPCPLHVCQRRRPSQETSDHRLPPKGLLLVSWVLFKCRLVFSTLLHLRLGGELRHMVAQHDADHDHHEPVRPVCKQGRTLRPLPPHLLEELEDGLGHRGNGAGRHGGPKRSASEAPVRIPRPEAQPVQIRPRFECQGRLRLAASTLGRKAVPGDNRCSSRNELVKHQSKFERRLCLVESPDYRDFLTC